MEGGASLAVPSVQLRDVRSAPPDSGHSSELNVVRGKMVIYTSGAFGTESESADTLNHLRNAIAKLYGARRRVRCIMASVGPRRVYGSHSKTEYLV